MTLVQLLVVRFGWYISSKEEILKGSGECENLVAPFAVYISKVLFLLMTLVCCWLSVLVGTSVVKMIY